MRLVSTSLWVWTLAGVGLASSFASMADGHARYLGAFERYQISAQERVRAELASAGSSGQRLDPALRVLRPPNPASVLIAGREETLPAAWDFAPWGVDSLAPYPPPELVTMLDGVADSASAIQVFGGLLGLLLGLWLVGRDQARGWLKALAALEVPMPAVGLAYATTGALVFAAVAAVWCGGLALVASGLLEPDYRPDVDWIRVTAGTWCYLVAMFGLGGFVGLVGRNDTAKLTAAASAWVAVVFLLPQAISLASGPDADMPGLVGIERDLRESYADEWATIEEDLWKELAKASDPMPTLLAADQAASAAFTQFDAAWLARVLAARVQTNARREEWARLRRAREDRLRLLSRLTPATVLENTLAEATGQGWAVARRWESSIATHHARLAEAIFDDRAIVSLRVSWKGDTTTNFYRRHPTLRYSEIPRPPEVPAARPWDDATTDARIGWIQALIALGVLCLAVGRVGDRLADLGS